MAVPAYVTAAAAAVQSGFCGQMSLDVSYPASVTAGHILLIAVSFRAGTTTVWDGDPPGWTSTFWRAGDEETYGILFKIADGSEGGGALNITCSYTGTTPRSMARCFVFSGVDQTAPIDTEGWGTEATGSGTTCGGPSLTTVGTDSLAIGLWIKKSTTTADACTGESGGDWTEPVAEGSASAMTLSLQTASMASPGTISGGTVTFGGSSTSHANAIELKSPAASGKAPPPRSPLNHLQHMLIR